MHVLPRLLLIALLIAPAAALAGRGRSAAIVLTL